MPVQTVKFALLLDLAKETSSDKRRDLLREITDALARDASIQTLANCAAFDEIAVAVVTDLKSEARSEISRMLSETTLPLGRTVRQLAMDEIAVAAPLLERSAALTDKDLVEVASTKSQAHLMAVTKRSSIGELVSDALVAHGEDNVVVSLLGNRGAQIARDTYERVALRAESSAILQAPLIRRQGVPLDLLNDLYVAVAPVLRQEILKQYESVSPAELDAALERSRKRVAKAYGGLPEDLETARIELRKLERAGHMQPPVLVRLMREGPDSRTLFLLAFAQLTEADYSLIRRLIDTRDIDAMALLCRAAGFDRALFVTLSLLVVSDDKGRVNLEEFGKLYERVPVSTAQRAVRFWKVRAAA
jgi:uncharacterized protein (DUF2336 family)